MKATSDKPRCRISSLWCNPVICWRALTALVFLVCCIAALRPAWAGDTIEGLSLIQTEQQQSYDDGPAPHPDLSPQDVVQLQLRSLAQNNTPHQNAGIEYAFRFASPSNRRATGPLPRFIQLLHHPTYIPMLNHRDAQFGETQIDERQAWQSVILTSPLGERAGYVFVLLRQRSGSCVGCWMTESVVRLPLKPQDDADGAGTETL
ncbi:MAG: DUF4864 domain-containing protein [Gammaproteobacteria bacterium]|nr:DUF4864 domain-containing protein [Gammaproteobacteria bacterium]